MALKFPPTNEMTPMISPERVERITANGTLELESNFHKGDINTRWGWFSAKFNHIYCILLILSLIMLAVLVMCIVLTVRLGRMESFYERTSRDAPQMVADLIAKIQKSQLDNVALPPLLPLNAASLGGTPIQPEVVRSNASNKLYQKEHQSDRCNQCKRNDFRHPPLVILSLDGFSSAYIDRGLITSFQSFVKCGASAESVLPSYPSRTFPNHYTMVTGLYPESHGIVDNNVFDPSISPHLENMKTTQFDAFWGGDPIWSVYKRQTGGRTACLFWPGCGHNNTGYPPDISPKYNKDLPFRNRFDIILDWLQLPPEERPGLITAYLDQPDSIGHYQKDDTDLDIQLKELDHLLAYFLSSLESAGLLECINLVIVSDHGMQKLNKTIYFEDNLNMERLVGANGVVGRIYNNGSDYSAKDLLLPFACREKELTAFTRKSMPTRKHYQKTSKVGDVILQGQPGITFYPSTSQDWHLSGDHGYDYLIPTMHTIFFARGPSIQKGTRVPKFQNIEYMNLWIELLGLKHDVPNNGTLGIMDVVLSSKPQRQRERAKPITECSLSFQLPAALNCGDCNNEELADLSDQLLRCSLTGLAPPPFTSDTALCYQNYCDKMVITGIENDHSTVLLEQLSINDVSRTSSCHFINAKYSSKCPTLINSTFSRSLSLSANNRSSFSNISSIHFPWNNGFIKTIFTPLNEITLNYVARFERLVSITGIGYDYDYDGIADTKKIGPPSHLFRILLSCSGSWSPSGFSCSNPSDTNTISFIFPHIEDDINCMTTSSLLLEYTSRIKDIELISGLNFDFPGLSLDELLQMKTRIHTGLW